jgi:hypothetical protein
MPCEPQNTNDDEVDGDNKIQQPGLHQNQDAGD